MAMIRGSRPQIVYVLPNYDPDTGSHFFHIYELIQRAAGHLDIKVIIERARVRPRTLARPYYCQRFSLAPLRFLELLFVLASQRLAGRRFFYVHYSFYGAFVSWLVTRLLGGTVYYWNCGMPWLYRRSFLEESMFRFILRHTILVTGTAGLAKEYGRHYGLDPQRIRVMPNWINVERFRSGVGRAEVRHGLGIAADVKVILFVHRLSHRKGAHLLPEIIAEVIRLGLNSSADSAGRNKNVIFVIAGSGPEQQNLESRIKNQELGPYVRLVGEVPHREIPDYFRSADIFMMPSEEEGFPHVLLEAMAAGRPYVASDVGGVREITPPELQPFVAAGGDVGGLTVKLSELLFLSEGERARISAAEQEWVKQYDIKAVLPKFLELFSIEIQMPKF